MYLNYIHTAMCPFTPSFLISITQFCLNTKFEMRDITWNGQIQINGFHAFSHFRHTHTHTHTHACIVHAHRTHRMK